MNQNTRNNPNKMSMPKFYEFLESKEKQQEQQQQQQQQQTKTQQPQQQQQQTKTEEDKWRNLLPSGYRFKPTDEELLRYLYSKLFNFPIPPGIIADVNVYEYDPLSLSAMAFDSGDEVFYFFTALDRKHPNGMRPNRGTKTGGYWRTTSKPIDITTIYNNSTIHHPNNSEAATSSSSSSTKITGTKRSLVYMVGKPPSDHKGIKTNWIMHEYTIDRVIHEPSSSSSQHDHDDQETNQLNKYIVCSIYHRQARGGDSDESLLLGKRKQQQQQRIEPNSQTETETEDEEFVVHKQKDDDEDECVILNPIKRNKVM